MKRIPWFSLVAWLLGFFLIASGIGNFFITPEYAQNYLRWGYPDWFHYLTGVLELTAGVCLLLRLTRSAGALLGSLVMLAAIGTVILHGEYSHALAPAIVLSVALIVLFTDRITRRRRIFGNLQ